MREEENANICSEKQKLTRDEDRERDEEEGNKHLKVTLSMGITMRC